MRYKVKYLLVNPLQNMMSIFYLFLFFMVRGNFMRKKPQPQGKLHHVVCFSSELHPVCDFMKAEDVQCCFPLKYLAFKLELLQL